VPNLDSAFNWDMLGNWFLHSYSNCDSFPVVMGSFWYLKVYYIVTVFGVLVLKFFPKHVKWIIGVCLALTVYFNIDNDVMKNFAPYYPSGQVGYVAYYLAVFLIATQLKGKKIKDVFVPVLYGLVALSLVIVFWYFGNEVFYKFNKQKFPPKIPYIVWSLLSLVTIFVLYNRLKITKDNFINYIGKNAIFYYFAQGMSSSVVYFLVAALKESVNTWVLMVLIYVLNVALAIVFAEILKKIDDYGWKVLEFLRKKTAKN
jgi:flagellar basal body-associated protein FliL